MSATTPSSRHVETFPETMTVGLGRHESWEASLAVPEKWPAGAPPPADGDHYWARCCIIESIADEHEKPWEHWQVVRVWWCHALVPSRLQVRIVGNYYLHDSSIVSVWGEKVVR